MNNNFEKLADLLRQGNFPDFISGLDDMLGDTHYQPVMADKLKEYLNIALTVGAREQFFFHLLGKGAKVEDIDILSFCMLCFNGERKTLEYLINHGFLPDDEIYSPLAFALNGKTMSVVLKGYDAHIAELLLEHYPEDKEYSFKVFEAIAENNHTQYMSQIPHHLTQEQLDTLMTKVIEYRQYEAIDFWLEKGAGFKMDSWENISRSCSGKIIDLFIEKGLQLPESKTVRKQLFKNAIEEHNYEGLDKLLEIMPEMDKKEKCVLFSIAIEAGNPLGAEILIRHGVNLNYKNGLFIQQSIEAKSWEMLYLLARENANMRINFSFRENLPKENTKEWEMINWIDDFNEKKQIRENIPQKEAQPVKRKMKV